MCEIPVDTYKETQINHLTAAAGLQNQRRVHFLRTPYAQ
ncbi:rCG46368, partial [Rattus norvegicus]